MTRMTMPKEIVDEIQAVIDRSEDELIDALTKFLTDMEFVSIKGVEDSKQRTEDCLEIFDLFKDSVSEDIGDLFNPNVILVLMFLVSEAGFYNISLEEILTMLRMVAIMDAAGILYKEKTDAGSD